MASDHNMTQAITLAVIDVARASLMSVREAEGPTKTTRAVHTVPTSSGPTFRQPTFDWKVQHK